MTAETIVQESRPSKMARRIIEFGVAGVVLSAVIAVPFVVSPGNEPSEPVYEAVAPAARDLVQKRLDELKEKEQTDDFDKLSEEQQQEFNQQIEREVTELVAQVDPPPVEIDESAENIMRYASIDSPEYDRNLNRWTFFLRFNVNEAVSQTRHGFRFKAYDEDGQMLVNDDVKLLNGAAAGKRVLAVIVVQDGDGEIGLLDKIARFRIEHIPQSEFVPGNGNARSGTGRFRPGSTTGFGSGTRGIGSGTGLPFPSGSTTGYGSGTSGFGSGYRVHFPAGSTTLRQPIQVPSYQPTTGFRTRSGQSRFQLPSGSRTSDGFRGSP